MLPSFSLKGDWLLNEMTKIKTFSLKDSCDLLAKGNALFECGAGEFHLGYSTQSRNFKISVVLEDKLENILSRLRMCKAKVKWSPFKVDASSQPVFSEILENQPSMGRFVREIETSLYHAVPELEDYRWKYELHVQFRHKGQHGGSNFCTWCGKETKHCLDYCHTCGTRTTGLKRELINKFHQITSEREHVTTTHSKENSKLLDISLGSESAFGPVKILRDKAVLLSGYVIQKRGKSRMFDSEVSSFSQYKTLEDFSKAAEEKYDPKGMKGLLRQGRESLSKLWKEGTSYFSKSDNPSTEEEVHLHGFLPFLSSRLVDEYNILREALIVECAIEKFTESQETTQDSHKTTTTLQIDEVGGTGDDMVRITGSLICKLDAYLMFKPFPIFANQITTSHSRLPLSCSIEEVRRCFMGLSGTMVALLENKLDETVEIVLNSLKKTHTIKLRRVVPQLLTYLDGTNQLLALVAKQCDKFNKNQFQQHVVVYSLTLATNASKEYPLPLRAQPNRKNVAEIVAIKFIPYDQKLTLLDADHTLHVWDWQTKRCEWQLDLEVPIIDYSFSPDGECLILFEIDNSRSSVNLKLSKIGSIKNFQRWSDIPELCYIKREMNIPKHIGENVSAEVYGISANEILICLSWDDYIVQQRAQFELNVKKVKYAVSEASESKDDIAESFSNRIRQFVELFTKFPTSLPAELRLANKLYLTLPDHVTNYQCNDIHSKVSLYISTKMLEEGKVVSSVPCLSVNNVVQTLGDAICEKNSSFSTRKISSGEWIKQLILLLPVQILRTQSMRLCPIIDGYNLQVSIKADTDQQAVAAATGEISFGPLTSIILAHEGRVKVAANVGRTSTGKSYLANHLLGTLFYVDAARCTDGIWMSAREVICYCEKCNGEKALVVSIDVEGLGSFSRSVQEDALLSQFTFAISSLVILNQREKVMDRDIRDMLLKFTSGMKVTKTGNVQNRLHGDETLFNATFAMALKDIALDERDSILTQVMAEIDTCQRQSLELQKLFCYDPYVVALPYQKSKEYYETLHEHLYDEVMRTSCVFNDGFTFFMKCVTIIGSLALSSSQPLSTEYLDSLKSFLKNNVEEAIKIGSMPLRNPRHAVPDYPNGSIQVIPSISDIQILDQCSSSSLSKAYKKVATIHSLDIFSNFTSVPCNAVTDLTIKVENETIELQVYRDEKRPISDIKIICEAEVDDADFELKRVLGSSNHFIAIKRPTEQDLQEHMFQIKDNETEIDISSQNAIIDFVQKLKNMFEIRFPREGTNEASWVSSFQLLVAAVVERRRWRLDQWVRLLAEEIYMQQKLLLERRLLEKFEELDEVTKLCCNPCGQEGCHFKCLLPHKSSIVSQCDCLNISHACKYPCFWGCRDESGTPVSCSLGAGHSIIESNDSLVHKCSAGQHDCQALCTVGTCLRQCTRPDGHCDEHHCQQSHFCSNTCFAPFCASPCMFKVDDMHQFCVCNQAHCTFPCEMPGCNEQCQVPDHFHSASENHIHHICSKRHQCYISCEHQGTCEVSQILDCPMRHFKAVAGETEFLKVTIQKSLTHSCSATVPESLSDMRLPGHTGKHKCDMNHQCSSRCPMCKYFCQEQVDEDGFHPGHKHNTHHGTMLQMYFICKDFDLQVDVRGSRVGCSDVAYNQLCEMYCLDLPEGGRGHVHLWQTPQEQVEDTQPITTEFKPDDGKPKTAFKHPAFWKYIQFEDPYPEKKVKKFMKCNYACSRCGKFCKEVLWHDPLEPGNFASGGHVSADGHHFPCQHNTNYLLLFDKSGSMSAKDISPKQPCHSYLNNRLGTVLECTLKFLDNIDQGTSRTSLIVFESAPKLLAEATTVCEMQELVRKILYSGSITADGGTNFNGALNLAKQVLQKHISSQEHTVCVFLSDGQCSVDLSIIDAFKQMTNDSFTLYTINCAAASASISLSSMVERVGGNSLALHCNSQIEMLDKFIDVAKRTVQQYHVLPFIEGFDPKLKVLEEKRKDRVRVVKSEHIQLISSYCSCELWDLVRKKAHPEKGFSDSNLNSAQGYGILILGTDRTICVNLVEASANFHNTHLYHINLESDDASEKLLQLTEKLDNDKGTAMLFLDSIEAMEDSTKELVQFFMKKHFSHDVSIVGLSCKPDLLINTVLLLFTEIIHVTLPETDIREAVIKASRPEISSQAQDSLTDKLVDLTAGLTVEQIKQVCEEAKSADEIRKILLRKQDLIGQEKSQHTTIKKLMYVHEKFLQRELLQPNPEIKDDIVTFLELLRRLINTEEADKVGEFLMQFQKQSKANDSVFPLILSIPEHFHSLKVLHLIASYLGVCILKLHNFGEESKLQFGTPIGSQNQEKYIIWTADVSAFLHLLKPQEHGMEILTIGCFNHTSLKQYLLKQETESDLNVDIIKCLPPSLDVRRMYLSDYIYNVFNINELHLNKEQNLYWIGYHTKGLCHLDLEQLVQQAYLHSLDAVFRSRYCQRLLFEKAEKPLYVACDEKAYGATSLPDSMPSGERLRPPPLDIKHLALALKKYFGRLVVNGKVLSQVILPAATRSLKEDDMITFTPDNKATNCSVQIQRDAVPENSNLFLTLSKVPSEYFPNRVTKEISIEESLLSDVVHVGPTAIILPFPLHFRLPFEAKDFTKIKLMNSSTVYGKPTDWKCVISMDLASDKIVSYHPDETVYNEKEKMIVTNKLGLWTWMGVKHVQPVKVKAQLYHSDFKDLDLYHKLHVIIQQPDEVRR